MSLQRGYTLSEAYALWRQRAAGAGVMTELAEHLDGDDADAERAAADGSDDE